MAISDEFTLPEKYRFQIQPVKGGWSIQLQNMDTDGEWCKLAEGKGPSVEHALQEIHNKMNAWGRNALERYKMVSKKLDEMLNSEWREDMTCPRCGGSGNDPEHAGPCGQCATEAKRVYHHSPGMISVETDESRNERLAREQRTSEATPGVCMRCGKKAETYGGYCIECDVETECDEGSPKGEKA